MLKLTSRELFAELKETEGDDCFFGIVRGLLLFRADPALWSRLLEDWGNSSVNANELSAAQKWMDEYSAHVRDVWSGAGE